VVVGDENREVRKRERARAGKGGLRTAIDLDLEETGSHTIEDIRITRI